MSDRTIYVGICLDERMLSAAFVLLASIKAHARPERPVKVFAVTSFSSKDLPDLAAMMASEAFELVPIAATTLPPTLPIRDYITAGTYLRFLLPTLLPDVAKILYLDVDTVVHHDLAPLFDVDLGGCALAGMPDHSMLLGSRTWPTFFIPFDGKRYRFPVYADTILGLPCPTWLEYFNCGVLVLDLDHWREHKVAERTVTYLADNPKLFLMDQDALNYVVHGHYVHLDPRWNAFASCAFPAYVNVMVRVTRVGRAWERLRGIWRNDPWIIHYAGANKPWAPRDPKTAKDGLWWDYAMLSPFKARIVAEVRAKETKAPDRRSKIPTALRDALV